MNAFRSHRDELVPPGAIDHQVADLSATFAADVTLEMAQKKLIENGQWLPIDGPADKSLGWLVEHNSTGPLRLGFGAWRDLLLGTQFLNGKNELISAGGQTVKNVAGYDLTKFMVGQHGVFGTIRTLTTRTYKAPTGAILAAFNPSAEILSRLLVTPCRPQWAVITRDALLCGYLGDRLTVDFYEANIPQHQPHELIRHTWEDDMAVRQKLWAVSSEGERTYRASIPPARVTEFAASIEGLDWRADAAFGIVIGSCTTTQAELLRTAAERVGGDVTFFDRQGNIEKRPFDAAVGALLARLKISFDPDGALKSLPVITP